MTITKDPGITRDFEVIAIISMIQWEARKAFMVLTLGFAQIGLSCLELEGFFPHHSSTWTL